LKLEVVLVFVYEEGIYGDSVGSPGFIRAVAPEVMSISSVSVIEVVGEYDSSGCFCGFEDLEAEEGVCGSGDEVVGDLEVVDVIFGGEDSEGGVAGVFVVDGVAVDEDVFPGAVVAGVKATEANVTVEVTECDKVVVDGDVFNASAGFGVFSSNDDSWPTVSGDGVAVDVDVIAFS